MGKARDHFKSLQAALTQLRNLFFIGIADHYDVSVCLLSYQVGVFDYERCTCPRHNPSQPHLTNRPGELKLSQKDVKLLNQWTTMDHILYNEALHIFNNRVLA